MNQLASRDPIRVCNFGPFQSLYEKARELINATCNHPEHEAPVEFALKLVALHDCVKQVETMAAESDSLDHVREIAEELYEDSSCDIEIEPTCTYHNETDGYWVMGWLWVPDSKVAEEAEDEEEDDSDYTRDDWQVAVASGQTRLWYPEWVASKRSGVGDNDWEEYPGFPMSDWQAEVKNGDTRLGYKTWVEHKKEEAADDLQTEEG